MVAAFVDSGDTGKWAEARIEEAPLAAPHLLLVEVANILRRGVLSGLVSEDVASLAHGTMLSLQVQLVSYEALAERCWELNHNLTIHDACYVALAERLSVPLVTLDVRLSNAAGPRCRFLTPTSA